MAKRYVAPTEARRAANRRYYQRNKDRLTEEARTRYRDHGRPDRKSGGQRAFQWERL